MNFAAVQYYLNDLPSTFKRPGQTFQWWYNSLAYGIDAYTSGMDGVLAQTSFAAAKWEWLDLWGNLYNVARLGNVTDSTYRQQIVYRLTLRGATPVSIQNFAQQVLGATSTVHENFSSSTWGLYLSQSTSLTPNTIAASLGVVRPAGVPFQLFVASGGLYLSTINFLGKTRVPGSWMTSSYTQKNYQISPGTPNTTSSLPTTYLTDPTINPTAPINQGAPIAALTTPNNTTVQLVLGTDAFTNFTIVTSDPNTNLGGSVNDKAFDVTSRMLYICTTSGTAATAVWTPINEAVGTYNSGA